MLTLRLLVLALRQHEVLNSTWVDTVDGPRIHVHPAVHLGVAVATPRGLLVPVVPNAQDKTTRELAGCRRPTDSGCPVRALSSPPSLPGSTFTVSNFGALGLDERRTGHQLSRSGDPGMGSLNHDRRG